MCWRWVRHLSHKANKNETNLSFATLTSKYIPIVLSYMWIFSNTRGDALGIWRFYSGPSLCPRDIMWFFKMEEQKLVKKTVSWSYVCFDLYIMFGIIIRCFEKKINHFSRIWRLLAIICPIFLWCTVVKFNLALRHIFLTYLCLPSSCWNSLW